MLLLRLFVNAVALQLSSLTIPGIEISDWQSLVAGTAIFTLVNMLVRPLAYLLSFCLIVATFGLFVVVINAAMLGATAWTAAQVGMNFRVDDFWSALSGALLISLVSVVPGVIPRLRPRG